MDLNAVKALIVGTYRGQGHGIYPTIEDFDYLENLVFELSPKGFLVYTQTSQDPNTGLPMHQERGYLRLPEGLKAEFVIAQPTGIAEISTGAIEAQDGVVRFSVFCANLLNSPTAKVVRQVVRHYEFDESGLQYRLDMATESEDLQLHLVATLERVGD